MAEEDFAIRSKVIKRNDELGLVFGWGMITKERDVEYFDTQGDAITEKALIEASADFMENSRVGGDMHEAADGVAVFAFPLTDEVAKAFGIECDKRGLLLAMKPSPDVYEKFRDGTYTGFSIGGRRELEEVVEP